jgi:hypothetical protein
LVCAFYDPVYYNPHYDSFPPNSNEELGHWVGVATIVGDALTVKLLTSNQKVIFMSVIRSALDFTLRHKRLAPLGGEKSTNHAGDKIFVRSNIDIPASEGPTVSTQMPTIDRKDLIGRSFLKDTEADGQRFRTKIVRAIIENDSELKHDPNHIRFLCELDGDTVDDIYTYKQILDFIERDN